MQFFGGSSRRLCLAYGRAQSLLLEHILDPIGEIVLFGSNVEIPDVFFHFLKLGHKQIAYLTGPPVAPWAHERFEGYRRALREANLEVDDKLVFQAGSTIEDGTKAALQMMNEKCHATAVQAVTDLVAVGCAETLIAQGMRIPDDISVAGFGNVMVAEYFRVPLTTVRQPKFRLGVAAMDAMMSLLRGQTAKPQRLTAELIERKSTAPPKPKVA